jgi:hypothetical protein
VYNTLVRVLDNLSVGELIGEDPLPPCSIRRCRFVNTECPKSGHSRLESVISLPIIPGAVHDAIVLLVQQLPT